MILLLTVPGCALCRNAKSWMRQWEIPFEEISLYSVLSDDSTLKEIRRSVEHSADLRYCSSIFRQPVELWKKHPSLIGRPVLWVEEGWIDQENHLELLNLLIDSVNGCSASCSQYALCALSRPRTGLSLLAANQPAILEEYKK